MRSEIKARSISAKIASICIIMRPVLVVVSKSCRGRRVQDLRHSAATFWLSNGIDVKTVQNWLGHATAQLTYDLYSHWMGNVADTASIAKVDALLREGHAGGTRALS